MKRRDATGHLDAKYAADLRRRSRESSPPPGEDAAFLPRARSSDSLAEALGEEFLEGATTGESAGVESRNQGVPEEDGGPFIVTGRRQEFARGLDRSNPKDATREPFPKVVSDGEDEDEGDGDDIERVARETP